MSTMTMVLTCVQSNHQMHHHLLILSTTCPVAHKYYQFDFLKPILHTAPLIDSTVATVTIFYFGLIIVCGGTRSGHNGTRGMTVAAMVIGARVG